MIRPPGFAGAAFGTARSGDLRVDHVGRASVSAALGIAPDWAFVKQVHGARVIEAVTAGDLGEADAIVTYSPGLPIAVATADCVPVVIESEEAVGVVHAGWRGAAAGPRMKDEFSSTGTPTTATLSVVFMPHIVSGWGAV